MINKLMIKFNALVKQYFPRLDIGDWLICGGFLAMFSRTFYRLSILGWRSADYTHAAFILPISLWLIWLKRDALKKREQVPVIDIVIFVLSVVLYLFSAVNDFMFLEAFSFVFTSWAIFKLRLTADSFKEITFPIVYLLFLVPPPGLAIDSLTLPLKKISTYGSYWILKLFQLPLHVYGAILKVGDHELFIADACSGFRSIATLLALGALYAYLQKLSVFKKWLIFLSVIPLGIIGNVLRITLTGLIAHYIGIRYAEGFFHETSGMLLFLFTTLALMALAGALSKCKRIP